VITSHLQSYNSRVPLSRTPQCYSIHRTFDISYFIIKTCIDLPPYAHIKVIFDSFTFLSTFLVRPSNVLSRNPIPLYHSNLDLLNLSMYQYFLVSFSTLSYIALHFLSRTTMSFPTTIVHYFTVPLEFSPSQLKYVSIFPCIHASNLSLTILHSLSQSSRSLPEFPPHHSKLQIVFAWI